MLEPEPWPTSRALDMNGFFSPGTALVSPVAAVQIHKYLI